MDEFLKNRPAPQAGPVDPLNDPATWERYKKVHDEYMRQRAQDEKIQQGIDVVRELNDPPPAPPKRQDAPNAGSPAIQAP